MTDLDRLERLNRLRESGALSPDEYEREKTRVLAGASRGRWPLLVGAMGLLTLVVTSLLMIGWPGVGDTVPSVEDTKPQAGRVASPPDAEALASPPSSKPSQVDPPVPTTAEPDPTNADYYNEAKHSMMRLYSRQPRGIREMLGDWAGANTLCRGSSDVATVDKWCPIRDTLSDNLENLGMCYGRPTDQSAAESDWHTCDEHDRQ